MSKGLYFDLDELNGETFQELCASLVLSEFTPLATPFGAPGKDGGIDARHFGELIDYATLFKHPHKIHSPYDIDVFWVFQAKFTRKEMDSDRQQAVVTSLKDEIYNWLESRWGKKDFIMPISFILMTNVRLNPKTRKILESLGLIFEYFECWDEAKIAAFIAGNESIRHTFFPNRDDKLEQMLKKITIGSSSIEIVQASSIESRGKGASGKFDFGIALEKLVKYEVDFVTQNNVLIELLKINDVQKDLGNDWLDVEIKAHRSGILSLNSDKKSLENLIKMIDMKNVFARHLFSYLGEGVKENEVIISFQCSNGHIDELNKLARDIFSVNEGENTAHREIDTYLLDLQSQILTKLESKRYQEVERLLGDFYQARNQYLDKKQNNPNTFYPNARTLGGDVVFGWDFIKLWNDIYKDILEILLRGNHTSTIVEKIVLMPFWLIDSAFLFQKPFQQFRTSFSLVKKLLYELEEENETELLALYFQNYKKLCADVADSEFQIKTLNDVELAIEIIKEIFDHVLNLIKRNIDGDNSISFESLESYMLILTSIKLHGVVDHTPVGKNSWQEVYDKCNDYHKKISLMRDEFYFAWSTYLWFKKRNANDFDFSPVKKIISKVKLDNVIKLYEKAKDKDSGWFGFWFNPKSDGRISVWSNAIDHDVKELLIAKLLTEKFTAEELLELKLLESSSSVNDFINEILKWHEMMTSSNKLNSSSYVEDNIRQSEKRIREKLDLQIASSKELSHRKITQIEQAFQEKLKKHSLEHVLYKIKVGIGRTKPKYQAGIHQIMDKVWFLENEGGYTSYHSESYGAQWAEMILRGRLQVLAIFLTKDMKLKEKEIDGLEFLELLVKKKGKHVLLINHRSIPWRISHKYIEHKKNKDSDQTRPCIGNVEIIYESATLKLGEAILLPNESLNWNIIEKVDRPSIRIVDSSSPEGKSIKRNPKNININLDMKVIAKALEVGFVSIEKGIKVEKFKIFNNEE